MRSLTCLLTLCSLVVTCSDTVRAASDTRPNPPHHSAPEADDTLSLALDQLRSVGPEGQRNAAASQAWPTAAQAQSAQLITILQAMDGANDLALNWIRAAFQTAAERALMNKALPLAALETFVRDKSNHHRARKLAWDWIAKAFPFQADRIISDLVSDPGPELRREAIERALAKIGTDAQLRKDPAALRNLYRMVLLSARDPDQIGLIATKLRDMGAEVDLTEVFGWLTQWQVIGPFDNTDRAGFERAFPPERESELDLTLEYAGKSGQVRWLPHQAKGDYGIVDLNPALGTLKEVTGYATTTFRPSQPGPAEIRLGCKNGWKLWLNGRFIFGRDEYHRAMEIDQYRFPIELQSGPNTILLKICQNEQTEDWTKEWEFQIRITDALGTPIPLAPATHANE